MYFDSKMNSYQYWALVIFAITLLVISAINVANLNDMINSNDPSASSALYNINIVILIGSILLIIYLIWMFFKEGTRQKVIEKLANTEFTGVAGKDLSEGETYKGWSSILKRDSSLSSSSKTYSELDSSPKKEFKSVPNPCNPKESIPIKMVS